MFDTIPREQASRYVPGEKLRLTNHKEDHGKTRKWGTPITGRFSTGGQDDGGYPSSRGSRTSAGPRWTSSKTVVSPSGDSRLIKIVLAPRSLAV